MAFALNTDEEEGEISKTPVKYVPLCDVYSATAPCVSASGSSMSKKVTARKLPNFDYQDDRKPSGDVMGKPPVTHVYSRRRNRCSPQNPSFFNDLTVKSVVVKTEVEEGEGGGDWRKRKRRKMGCSELINLGVDSSVLRSLCSPRESRSSRKKSKSSNVGNEIKPQQQSNGSLGENAASKMVTNSGSIRTKKWAQYVLFSVNLHE